MLQFDCNHARYTVLKLHFFQIGLLAFKQEAIQVTPDDHSVVEPPLPIPNRTVKRLCADDSEQCACESRSSSGFYFESPFQKWLGLLFLVNRIGR